MSLQKKIYIKENNNNITTIAYIYIKKVDSRDKNKV